MEINNMKIKFVIVSKDTNFKLLNEDFNKAHDIADISTVFIENNTKSLASVYNNQLQQIRINNEYIDYLVFMHSDVSFNIRSFITNLNSVGPKYDALGLCGTSTMNVSQSPLNWWTGSNPTPYDKWGCVTHGELGDQTSYFSSHSPNVMDHEVSCIDGLCIIFNNKVINSDIKFDENIGKFDFYDTDISFQLVMTYKFKLGVMVCKDLCHYSIGKSIMTNDFLENELKFRQKWNLPIPNDSAIAKYLALKNSNQKI